MFSQETIVELSRDFVCVKADPASADCDPDTLRFKKTRFVPNIVFVSPEGKRLGEWERKEMTPSGLKAKMEKVLAHVRR